MQLIPHTFAIPHSLPYFQKCQKSARFNQEIMSTFLIDVRGQP